MRTSLLKRFSAGVMAVATAATLFVGLSAASVADTIPSGVTYGGLTVTGITVNGTAATSFTGDSTTGVVAVPVPTSATTGTIKIVAKVSPALGTYVSAAAATEVADTDGTAILPAAKLTTGTSNDLTLADLTTEPKVSTLGATKTITFTLPTAIAAADGTAYIKLSSTVTPFTASAFAFWPTGTIADRRVIPTANVDATNKIITIYYDHTADSALTKSFGDTLPAITVGKVTAAGKTVFTAAADADYTVANIAASTDITKSVAIGTDTYTVKFVTEPIAALNSATWGSATLKAAMAYSVELNIGGTTYTIDKASTTGFAWDAPVAPATSTTVLTLNKVTSLTGSGTLSIKGAYLYATQTVSVTAAELAGGKTITLAYKDGTTSSLTVKANASQVTASSAGIDGSAITTTVMINGAASTKYNVVSSKTTGIATTNINLVGDVLPDTLQVKVANSYFVGGSATVDVKFYNQIFPIQLTDGSYYYLSVNVDSTANYALPITKFDYIGVYNTNIDYRPLITWDQSKPSVNKVLYVDFCGTLTDRTTTYGVLPDGVTSKLYPTTSYYAPNSDYTKTDWFYARWTEGTDLKGTTVRFTRPYVVFDITDATTKNVVSYSAVFVNTKQELYATATNSTLGGQSAVVITPDNYNQTWKADAAGQYIKDTLTTTPGQIDIASYYASAPVVATDYVIMTLRLPRGCTLTMPTLATGDISGMTVIQSLNGNVGNTTIDGLVDYVVKFTYRDIYTGSNSVGLSTLRVKYPMTNANGSASVTAYKDYNVVTTWTAKSYIAEKKVTYAGITVPSAIVDPTSDSSSVASSKASSTASSKAASSTKTSSSLPTNPNTGVPFNAIAYAITIAASAIGGVSTMVIRKK